MRNINSICFMATLWVSLGFSMTALALEPVSPDQSETVKGNNAFAVELYGQLKNQPGNLFFSPESISTALAMTYAGARGETAAEIAKTLHFTLPPDKLHPAMGALLQSLNAPHSGYQLHVANALWLQKDFPMLDTFRKTTQDNYGATAWGVDFKSATEASRHTINQWVEGQTKQKIKELLKPGVLTRTTRLVMTNAIYFKGDWQTQFKKEDTKEEDFHVSSTQTVKAPLMHRADRLGYFDGGTFQELEIPYKNYELSAIIFLPRNVDGLASFEHSMNAASIEQWYGQLQPVPEVIVTMPKFKMETQFGLKETLQAMGINHAFDGEMADFSGMVPRDEVLRDANLYISDLIHKAYIDLNEEGTEAAAATAVAVGVPSIVMREPPPIIFRANHPFLFLIRDNKSGSILFIGRVESPQV